MITVGLTFFFFGCCFCAQVTNGALNKVLYWRASVEQNEVVCAHDPGSQNSLKDRVRDDKNKRMPSRHDLGRVGGSGARGQRPHLKTESLSATTPTGQRTNKVWAGWGTPGDQYLPLGSSQFPKPGEGSPHALYF